jgi:protease I
MEVFDNLTPLTNSSAAIQLIQQQYKKNKLVAPICSGTTVLINAGLAQGTTLTGSPSIEIDLVNAGAKYLDQPVVVVDKVSSDIW